MHLTEKCCFKTYICFSPEQESLRLEDNSLEFFKSLEQGGFEPLGLLLDKVGGSLLSTRALSSRESISPSEQHKGKHLFTCAAHRY